jgi:hypothetical protein
MAVVEVAPFARTDFPHALEVAGSRIMIIGQIERILSHFGSTDAVDSKAFITVLLRRAFDFA